MNHDDELFHRAVAHWRETDGRTIPPPLMNLALERARILRARTARDFFRDLVSRRRKARMARLNGLPDTGAV